MSPPMGIAPQSATVIKVEPRTAMLEAVPLRMARVLQHAPRAHQQPPQKHAAAN